MIFQISCPLRDLRALGLFLGRRRPKQLERMQHLGVRRLLVLRPIGGVPAGEGHPDTTLHRIHRQDVAREEVEVLRPADSPEHGLMLRVRGLRGGQTALGLLHVGVDADGLQLLPDHLGHGSVGRHLPAHGHQLIMHNIA